MEKEQKEISDLCEKLKRLVGNSETIKKFGNREIQGIEKIDQLIAEQKILELQKFDFRDELLEVIFCHSCKKLDKVEQNSRYIVEYISEEIEDKKCNVVQKTAFGKKWAKKNREYHFNFDYEQSALSMYIFAKTIVLQYFDEDKMVGDFGISRREPSPYNYIIKKNDDKHEGQFKGDYIGDVMNSWATILEEFPADFWGDYFGEKCPNTGLELWEYLSNGENYKYGKLKKPLPLYITDFLDVVYTIGNFIPLPQNRNKYEDYWDLFLAGVYNYFHSEKVINIEELSDIYINWLKNCYEEGENGWNEFVERNYMQPFVKELEDGNFGEPLELWDGHFNGEMLPNEEWQFKQFFVNARERILARGWLIAEALIKNAE